MELATLRTLYFANLYRQRRISAIVRATDAGIRIAEMDAGDRAKR